jgi:hypothetical protein
MYNGLSVGLKELMFVNQAKINVMRDAMLVKGYEIM